MSKNQKNLSITTLLMFVLFFSILICSTNAAAISITVFYKNQLRSDQTALAHTTKGVAATLDDWRATLTGNANVIAAHPDITSQIGNALNGNSHILTSHLSSLGKTLGVDILAVTDTNGIVIGAKRTAIGTDLSSSKAFKNAFTHSADEEPYFYEALADIGYALTVSKPIIIDGQIHGIVITGYDLIQGELLKQIAIGYNVDYTLFNGSLRIASTIRDHKTGKSLVGTTLANAQIREEVLLRGKTFSGYNTIGGAVYACVYAPLKSSDGVIGGIMMVGEDIEPLVKVRSKTVQIVCITTLLTMAVLLFIGFISVNWGMKRMNNVTNFLNEMATGEANLAKRINKTRNDEVGDLIDGFNAFCEKLRLIVKEIKESKTLLSSSGDNLNIGVNEASAGIQQMSATLNHIVTLIAGQNVNVQDTAGAVNEIASNIVSLERMVEHQSANVTEASAAVEQMISNIKSVNTNVEHMAESFNELERNAMHGIKTQEDVNERIKLIEAQSDMLQEANATITNIADKTNLLAMNAAIEAAHAGDAGKGFAVVSDEIRKLSETSSAQSKTIGQQLTQIKASILDMVAASVESGKAFAAVSGNIRTTQQLVSEIKTAMEEQSTGSLQISEALNVMNHSTSEVRNASAEMTAGNKEILLNMQNLSDSSSTIKDEMDSLRIGADKISGTGKALSDCTKTVEDAIDKISSQVDLFTV